MKIVWIFIIPIIMMSCNNHHKEANTGSDIMSNHTVFSIEKISKEEYILAYLTSDYYNVYPQQVDSITQQDVLNVIFQNAKERIAALDPDERCSLYESVSDDELYCVDNLLYYPDLRLLGLKVPLDIENNSMWWYDSTTGKSISSTYFEPVAMNTDGIYVCQALRDCDIILDLHFFKKRDDLIYEIQSYRDCHYYGEYMLLTSEEENYKRIFWHRDNQLYLCSFNTDGEYVFLKISLDL